MARDAHPSPFPFPIPDPPRLQPHATPFPPPPLPPRRDETVSLLTHRVAGIPLPLFFAIGAIVGVVLAVSVLTHVRRAPSKGAARATLVSATPGPRVNTTVLDTHLALRFGGP